MIRVSVGFPACHQRLEAISTESPSSSSRQCDWCQHTQAWTSCMMIHLLRITNMDKSQIMDENNNNILKRKSWSLSHTISIPLPPNSSAGELTMFLRRQSGKGINFGAWTNEWINNDMAITSGFRLPSWPKLQYTSLPPLHHLPPWLHPQYEMLMDNNIMHGKACFHAIPLINILPSFIIIPYPRIIILVMCTVSSILLLLFSGIHHPRENIFIWMAMPWWCRLIAS